MKVVKGYRMMITRKCINIPSLELTITPKQEYNKTDNLVEY